MCLGGGLETSRPRGVGSCGEGVKEEQEQQRTGRENDQANQIEGNRPLAAAAAAMTTTQPEAVAGRERQRGRTKKKGT